MPNLRTAQRIMARMANSERGPPLETCCPAQMFGKLYMSTSVEYTAERETCSGGCTKSCSGGCPNYVPGVVPGTMFCNAEEPTIKWRSVSGLVNETSPTFRWLKEENCHLLTTTLLTRGSWEKKQQQPNFIMASLASSLS